MSLAETNRIPCAFYRLYIGHQKNFSSSFLDEGTFSAPQGTILILGVGTRHVERVL